MGTTTTIGDQAPAGGYPFFDFVQGPITPRAQGSNWTHAVLADHTQSNAPLRYEIPPNSVRRNILRVEFQPLGADDLYIVVEDDSGSDTPLDVGGAFREDLDGVLGTGASMDLEDDNVWESRYDGRRSTTRKDCNGWWLVSATGTSTSPAGTYYRAYLRDGILPTTASYTPTSGTLTMGRVGGPEMKFATHDVESTGGTKINQSTETSPTTEGEDEPANPYLPATDFYASEPASAAIGTGFQAGMAKATSMSPSHHLGTIRSQRALRLESGPSNHQAVSSLVLAPSLAQSQSKRWGKRQPITFQQSLPYSVRATAHSESPPRWDTTYACATPPFQSCGTRV